MYHSFIATDQQRLRCFKCNEKEGDNEFDDNDNDDKYSEDCFIGEK